MYVLIFSATKQVGALVFSLVFWTASSLVYNDQIRKSLLLSSIGIAILYGSLAIAPLQYHVYPPYGLITEAFIPLVPTFCWDFHLSQEYIERYVSKETVLQECL